MQTKHLRSGELSNRQVAPVGDHDFWRPMCMQFLLALEECKEPQGYTSVQLEELPFEVEWHQIACYSENERFVQEHRGRWKLTEDGQAALIRWKQRIIDWPKHRVPFRSSNQAKPETEELSLTCPVSSVRRSPPPGRRQRGHRLETSHQLLMSLGLEELRQAPVPPAVLDLVGALRWPSDSKTPCSVASGPLPRHMASERWSMFRRIFDTKKL